jgi:hypothetical protein
MGISGGQQLRKGVQAPASGTPGGNPEACRKLACASVAARRTAVASREVAGAPLPAGAPQAPPTMPLASVIGSAARGTNAPLLSNEL